MHFLICFDVYLYLERSVMHGLNTVSVCDRNLNQNRAAEYFLRDTL